MASGKTSVGLELAALLGWEFRDFDVAIERRAGLTVSEIFAGKGEEHFRRLESEVAVALLPGEQVVLATGGGWPAQPGSWEAVPEGTLSVWLRVSPGVAVQRASSEGAVRPLLAGERPLDRAVELLGQRETSYARAQVALDSDGDDPAALAKTIMNIIRSESDRE
jgi:shikimate kinase